MHGHTQTNRVHSWGFVLLLIIKFSEVLTTQKEQRFTPPDLPPPPAYSWSVWGHFRLIGQSSLLCKDPVWCPQGTSAPFKFSAVVDTRSVARAPNHSWGRVLSISTTAVRVYLDDTSKAAYKAQEFSLCFLIPHAPDMQEECSACIREALAISSAVCSEHWLEQKPCRSLSTSPMHTQSWDVPAWAALAWMVASEGFSFAGNGCICSQRLCTHLSPSEDLACAFSFSSIPWSLLLH